MALAIAEVSLPPRLLGTLGPVIWKATSSLTHCIFCKPRPFNWEFRICLQKLCLSSVHTMSSSRHDIGCTEDKRNFWRQIRNLQLIQDENTRSVLLSLVKTHRKRPTREGEWCSTCCWGRRTRWGWRRRWCRNPWRYQSTDVTVASLGARARCFNIS